MSPSSSKTGEWNTTQPEPADATGRFMSQVLHELRSVAAFYLQGERRNHTLQPTELVHEAYLKLADSEAGRWNSRTHFFAVAASAVRQVLVDHARSNRAQKRNMGRKLVSLQDFDLSSPQPSLDILTLDESMKKLARLDTRQHQVVEMRFFAGLSIDEMAAILNVSPRTVKNLWRAARAWLIGDMRGQEGA